MSRQSRVLAAVLSIVSPSQSLFVAPAGHQRVRVAPAASCANFAQQPFYAVAASRQCLVPRPQLAHAASAARSRAIVADEAAANEPDEIVQPKIGPFPLKYVVLCLLVLQNSLTAILARESRVPRVPGQQLYLGSVAVFMAEAIKLPVCTGLIVRDAGGIRPAMKQIYQQVFVKWGDTLRMGVPAACYCVQNLLFFVALSRLSATSYQLWSQSKTLFTALFFVVYLGRVLRKQQWIALVLLSMGVGLVQFYEAGGAAAAAAAAASSTAASSTLAIGVAAVLASSLLSGFANVYFEKVVKTRPAVSIWMRNVQLGLFSLPQVRGARRTSAPSALFLLTRALFSCALPQAASLIAADSAIILERGSPFVGFNLLACSVISLKAFGGLLVAVVVKYADNLLKTYATAIAIVLTCVVGCVSTGTMPSLGFVQGMMMVLASIFLYNLKDLKFLAPKEKKEEEEEK